MNNQGKYLCPICGADNMCTDFTDGFKWGRAYCNSCDCAGPEVRTGYEESLDAPWRTEARKQFAGVANEYTNKPIAEDNNVLNKQPDPITGLVPCGCGGKAGFHYSVMLRDNDCYVECGVCGGHTRVALSEDRARDAWNTAMGYTAPPRPGAIGPGTGEMDPNGDEGVES